MQALAVALLVVALTGCVGGESPPPSRSTPPQVSSPPTTSSPTPRQAAALRKRLVASLQAAGSYQVNLVETGVLTVVPAGWLPGWQIIDVLCATPHPRRFYLGLSDDGTVVSLSGQPESFHRMVTAANPHIGSAKAASELAADYLDTNRSFQKYSYRIDGIDDIECRTKLNADEARVRRHVEQTYGRTIVPPQPRRSGAGWRLTVWMVYDNQLIRHDLEVAPHGVVVDRSERVFEGMPTPETV